MKSKIIYTFIAIIICIGVGLIINENEKTTATSASIKNENKIEWGIKREDNHKQPDVGTVNREIMEETNSIYLGNNENKYIYLTFDNGYEAGYTDEIINTLKNNNVTATFFVTAHYVNTAGELVQKMIDNGNIIGNHTVNHKSMPTLGEDDIKKEVMNLHDKVKEKYNYEMKYIRPPMGEYNKKTIEITNSYGYKTVMWSFAYSDWDENNQPNENEAKEKIISNLHNGEVMLLHATSKTNMLILNDLINSIKQEGYEIRSIDNFEK